MRILKQEVYKALKSINQEWVNAIKKAEKEDEALDTSEITNNIIDKITQLDDKFEEYQIRQKEPKKKGGFF